MPDTMVESIKDYEYGMEVLARHGGAISEDNLLDILCELTRIHDLKAMNALYSPRGPSFDKMTPEKKGELFTMLLDRVHPYDIARRMGINRNAAYKLRKKFTEAGIL